MTSTGIPPVYDSPPYRRYLLALVILGLLVRIYYFTLTLGSDDQRWVLAARQLFGERPLDLYAEYYARIVWRFVLWVWGLPWGLSLESTVPLMFLLFVVTILAVAGVTRLCFGSGAALVAAAIVATHPFNILYDTRTLPDGLGVAMLMVALLLFVDHWLSRRLVSLAGAGLLIGLTVSVKEYFVLLALPCVAALALRGRTERAWAPVAMFALAMACAVGVDVALHALDAEPLAHWRAQAAYGDRLLARQPESGPAGMRLVATMAAERLLYVRLLFFDQPGTGVLLLWGLLVMAVKARRDAISAIVLSTTAVFLAFLSLMPARFRPFLLVELQERYVTVVLPFAAIAAGVGVARAFGSLPSRAERRVAVIGLGILLVANVVVADGRLDGYRMVEFTGIRGVLATARDRGIGELILPHNYEPLIPDRYHRYGVRLAFLKVNDEESGDQLRRYVAARPDRAVFVPRTGIDDWPVYAVPQDSGGHSAVASAAALIARLGETDFTVEEVTAPYTTWRSWLALAGVTTRGKVVGWLYRPKPNPTG